MVFVVPLKKGHFYEADKMVGASCLLVGVALSD